MKKILILGALIMQVILPDLQAQKATVVKQPVLLKTSIDSFSYALGISVAQSLKMQGADSVNTALIERAIRDQFYNNTSLLKEEQVGKTLQEKLLAFAGIKAGKEKEASAAFLEKNKSKAGVTTLPNGLQYEILKPATGPKPALADQVKVHYTGKLINGTTFDSSVERGEPATFPLSRVIKGWTEILQLMPKGSKWRVYIPSDLAYGERGGGGKIPPHAALIFDIELLDIIPAQ